MSAALIEQIKDDLGYLKLHRSSEVFATLAEAARRDDQSHLEFLAALVAEEAAATRQRRLAARLRFAHFRCVPAYCVELPQTGQLQTRTFLTLSLVKVMFLTSTRLTPNANTLRIITYLKLSQLKTNLK